MRQGLLFASRRSNRRRAVAGGNRVRSGSHHRRLLCEPLEDRRLLSVASSAPELFCLSPALFVENHGQWVDESPNDEGERAAGDEIVAMEQASAKPSGLKNEVARALPGKRAVTRPSEPEQQPPIEYIVGDSGPDWSTYLGGSDWDWGYGVAVDADGNTWVAGSTKSAGWVDGGYDTTFNGGEYDGFVVKLAGDGSHLWSTYLGGSGEDWGFSIAVDDDGNGWVVGNTGSSDWISGGYNGGDRDAFVVKLGGDGSHLWSTYLGGVNYDSGHRIAVDGDGNVWVSGATESPDWVDGGHDTTLNGGRDAFVVKLATDGSHLWSTYLGGSGNDEGRGIAVDGDGNAVLTGMTESAGWVYDGYNTTYGGNRDAFAVRLATDGTHLWSSYLGGSESDLGLGLAVDDDGDAWVSGETTSPGWVSGGYDTTYNGGDTDAFVVKLAGDGSHLWSTYLGGNSHDGARGIAVDGAGNGWVTGYAHSAGWVAGGQDTTQNGDNDPFVAKFTSDGMHLWSTFLGGYDYDFGYGIAVGGGGAWVSGHTTSLNWISGGFDTTYGEGGDGFVYRIQAPIPGDANWDRVVNDQDASILAAHWQMQSNATWGDGDFNADGVVNDRDASIMAAHWLESGEGAGDGEDVAVPDGSKDEVARALPRKRVLARPSEPEQQSPIEHVVGELSRPAEGGWATGGGMSGNTGKQDMPTASVGMAPNDGWHWRFASAPCPNTGETPVPPAEPRVLRHHRAAVHDAVLREQIAWSLELDRLRADGLFTDGLFAKDTRSDKAMDRLLMRYGM